MQFDRATLLRSSLAFLAIAAFSLPASAAKLFRSSVVIDGVGTQASGENDIRKVDRLFSGTSFRRQFPGYVGDEAVEGVIDMRGVELLRKLDSDPNASLPPAIVYTGEDVSSRGRRLFPLTPPCLKMPILGRCAST